MSRQIFLKNKQKYCFKGLIFFLILDGKSQVFEFTKSGQLKNYFFICLDIEVNHTFVRLNKCDAQKQTQIWSYKTEVNLIITINMFFINNFIQLY